MPSICRRGREYVTGSENLQGLARMTTAAAPVMYGPDGMRLFLVAAPAAIIAALLAAAARTGTRARSRRLSCRASRGNDRLRDVRQVPGHAVALADSKTPQGCSDRGNLSPHLRPGHDAGGRSARLPFADDGGRVRSGVAQDLVGIVQFRCGEPSHLRHPVAQQHRLGPPRGQNAEVVLDRIPELPGLVDRPSVQRPVVLQGKVVSLLEPYPERLDVRLLDRRPVRRPDGLLSYRSLHGHFPSKASMSVSAHATAGERVVHRR